MDHFAEQLKKLRLKQNFTMQALADSADVSKSMISKIESGAVQPTLDIAARLAKALGKTLSEMLHAQHAVRTILLSKTEQAVWQDPKSRVIRRNISPIFQGLKVEWLHVEIPPGSGLNSMPASTPGTEKYILMIKGILKITANEEVFELKKGDSFYFDGTCPHEFTNPTKETTEYYLVIKHG